MTEDTKEKLHDGRYRVFTSKAYIKGECGHDEYYNQFVNKAIKSYVQRAIGFDNIVNSKDPHFNDIPLRLWDAISNQVMQMANKELWKACNNSMYAEENKDKFIASLSDGVCVAKNAAGMIRKEHGKPSHYIVQVRFKDTDDTITTGINGTPESIKEYYAFGKRFNIGTDGSDRMATVKEVRFL